MTRLTTILNEVNLGNMDRARKLLVAHLKEQRDDVEAWYVLSEIAPKLEQRIRALKHMVQYAPADARARERLKQLKKEISQTNSSGNQQGIGALANEQVYEEGHLTSMLAESSNGQDFYLMDTGKTVRSSEPVIGLSEDEWRQVAQEILLEELAEDESGNAKSVDLVKLFFEDVNQLPIISNSVQQFWLGAQLQAPTILQTLNQPPTLAQLLGQIQDLYEELVDSTRDYEPRLPRLHVWLNELRQVRRNIYGVRRSRVFRFLHHVSGNGLSTAQIKDIEDKVCDLAELLCLLPETFIQQALIELNEGRSLSTVLAERPLEEMRLFAEISVEERAERRRKEAIQVLAAGYLRYGLRIASNYIGRGLEFLDLVQEAYLGLWRAASRFNYREHGQFAHYGTTWIWQHVTRAVTVHGRTIRLPVHLAGELESLQKAEVAYATGQYPLSEDLPVLVALDLLRSQEAEQIEDSRRTGRVSNQLKKRYRRAQRKVEKWERWGTHTYSLEEISDQALEEKDAEVHWTEIFANYLVDGADDQASAELERTQVRRQLLDLLHLAARSERDVEMFKLRFGFTDGKEQTLAEVGEAFGLSRERVRQVEKRVLETIETNYKWALTALRDSSWLESWSTSPPRLGIEVDLPERKQEAYYIDSEKARLAREINELPRGSWRRRLRHGRHETREEQLRDALQEIGAPAHYQDIFDVLEEDGESPSLRGVYSVLSAKDEVFVQLGEGHFSLLEWEMERAVQENPVLPFCPQPLPDPPGYEDAFFEAVIVAHNRMSKGNVTAEQLLDEMFAWAQVSESVPKWRKQSYLSAFYVVGLIPNTFYYGGDNQVLSSQLPDLPIKEMREHCLRLITERVSDMPLFWWLLSNYAPARPTDLAEEFMDAQPDALDDTYYRLYLLAGMGAVRRLAYGRYELTPLGMQTAQELGRRPQAYEQGDEEGVDNLEFVDINFW